MISAGPDRPGMRFAQVIGQIGTVPGLGALLQQERRA